MALANYFLPQFPRSTLSSASGWEILSLVVHVMSLVVGSSFVFSCPVRSIPVGKFACCSTGLRVSLARRPGFDKPEEQKRGRAPSFVCRTVATPTSLGAVRSGPCVCPCVLQRARPLTRDALDPELRALRPPFIICAHRRTHRPLPQLASFSPQDAGGVLCLSV